LRAETGAREKEFAPTEAPRGLPRAKRQGQKAQPVSAVKWVDRDSLTANHWNPNKTARPEMILLAISILEDGWTQPIVARQDGTIIDGFHRWTVAGWGPVAAATNGKVPVVFLSDSDPAQERMATIRHNRARGTHYVVSMAELVAELVDLDVAPEEIAARLQMEPEEVTRLLDRGSMTKRGGTAEFGKAWKPK
jgi:ParB-like chromosome segregation protein Spo0J